MSFSLFLYAENSDEFNFAKASFIEYLIELEFLAYSKNSETLLPGKLLMDYITFLGCSPSLKLGEIDSTIKFHLFNQLSGMGGESVESIKYPGCKHPVHEPSTLLSKFEFVNSWTCPVCGLTGKTDSINWRKTAGFSKFFIEVSQIFPKEAIPSDKLLSILFGYTNTHWKWFYSKSTPR